MEFTLKNKTYSIGGMSTFDQLLVARKLGPTIPLIEGLVKTENASKDLSLLMLMSLGQLSDDASDLVVMKCLSCVSRQQEKGWAKVASNGQIMFDDMDMGEILKLTAAVIENKLGDFFRTALGDLVQAAEKNQNAS